MTTNSKSSYQVRTCDFTGTYLHAAVCPAISTSWLQVVFCILLYITFSVDLRFGRAIYRWKALSIIYNFCEMSFFQIRKLSWSNLALKLQCLRFQVHFSPCDFSFVPNFPIFSRAFSLLFSSILSLVKPYKSIKHN